MAQNLSFIISLAFLALFVVDAQNPVFSAYKKDGVINAELGKPLILPDLMTSVGGGYDSASGVYIVPKSGVYAINLRVMVYGSTLLGVHVTVGDKVVGTLSVYNRDEWDQNSITCVVNLKKGDKVSTKVKRTKSDNVQALNRMNTVFSGYFITSC